MATKKIVRPVRPGFQYTVFLDGDTDDEGRFKESSAGRIIGGWAPTRAKADALAIDTIEREA